MNFKKGMFGLFLLVIALALTIPAFAAGSVTPSYGGRGDWKWVKLECTAGAGGAFSDYTIPVEINGAVLQVITDPGGTAPTANYDITLLDANGVDLMGGSLANRSETATEIAQPLVNGNYGAVFTSGAHTLTVSNNAVASATFTVIIYYLDMID